MKIGLVPWVLAAAVAIGVAGCASGPAVESEAASGRIIVGENLNPNAEGRPSPVVLTIYQLRGKDAFVGASFGDLAERDQEILGNSLLSRDTLMLCPIEAAEEPRSGRASRCQGEVKPITLEISGEARFLGVVAGFYDLHDPSGDWRDAAEIPEAGMLGMFGSREFVIQLRRATVSVRFE